jgi:hypothetical protein
MSRVREWWQAWGKIGDGVVLSMAFEPGRWDVRICRKGAEREREQRSNWDGAVLSALVHPESVEVDGRVLFHHRVQAEGTEGVISLNFFGCISLCISVSSVVRCLEDRRGALGRSGLPQRGRGAEGQRF